MPTIYNVDDVAETMKKWQTLKYHEDLNIGDGLVIRLRDSGHVLGSAMIEFAINNKKLYLPEILATTPPPSLKIAKS